MGHRYADRHSAGYADACEDPRGRWQLARQLASVPSGNLPDRKHRQRSRLDSLLERPYGRANDQEHVMASIPYWSQLQPSPRDASIATSLAACVRDPAWMRSRKWQLGEFAGADAGSPAFARITSRTARLKDVAIGSATVTLADGQLLEPLVEAESFGPDLATRVELGQSFESLVTTTIRDLFRGAYPIGSADATTDPATARFLAVCAGRAVDGGALYLAAKDAQRANHPLPDRPGPPTNLQHPAPGGIATFIHWC